MAVFSTAGETRIVMTALFAGIQAQKKEEGVDVFDVDVARQAQLVVEGVSTPEMWDSTIQLRDLLRQVVNQEGNHAVHI